MAPFRNRDRSNRSGRGQIEHNVLEGLPINQYREIDVTIGPNSADNKPVDKDAWPELPMPRDSHMLPEHSQQLLRAARSGRVFKPPVPPEDDNEMKDEEEESKEVQIGFTVKKYVKVARHLEAPEPEYLAKRRKGLPSPYVHEQVAAPAAPLRETKVKKQDAEGNVAVYKVLAPEGQAVEGEVQPTDAAIEIAPIAAAPGTVVEGVGVVNAEGVVVANDVLQQTPPRRRPPPPKKKKLRGGPGRKRKTVGFVEGAVEHGTPASTTSGEMLAVPGQKQEDGSVAASDGGDTPMADAGDDEGSGEEGSGDEDHDMDHISAPATPATPARQGSAPTSVPALDSALENGVASLDQPPASEGPMATSVEASNTPVLDAVNGTSESLPEIAALKRDTSSPDLPLNNPHSRQNSMGQLPTSATTAELAPESAEVEMTGMDPISAPTSEAIVDAPVEIMADAPVAPLVEPIVGDAVGIAPEPVPEAVIPAPSESITELATEPAILSAPEPVAEAIPEPVVAPILEPTVEPVIPVAELAPEPAIEPIPESVPESVVEPVIEQTTDRPPSIPQEPTESAADIPPEVPLPSTEPVTEPIAPEAVPETAPQPISEPVTEQAPEVPSEPAKEQPSAPPSEPDLLRNLERHLEQEKELAQEEKGAEES